MRRNALLAFPLVALACGGAGSPTASEDTGTIESEARAGDERATGSYEVPVDSAELAQVATNPVSVKFRPVGAGLYRLKYDLPTVIAGNDKGVDLMAQKTSAGTWQLSGPSGTGTCTESPVGELVCHEKLTGVATNLSEATSAVNALATTRTERAARVEIAKRFNVDPLGVLTFKRATGKR